MWIAFKNYYLRDTKQLSFLITSPFERCELLSKIIIFVTRNNKSKVPRRGTYVVNCFQKLLSSWHETTWVNPGISFKAVVNCFQKLLSSWHETTETFWPSLYSTLWIAFKNYYLRDTKQRRRKHLCGQLRCELLSKIIIFVTRNNRKDCWRTLLSVVNCFQKLLSSWHETTLTSFFIVLRLLWIAFKNYYLRDTKQRQLNFQTMDASCELLSKIIIFVTRNNSGNYL